MRMEEYGEGQRAPVPLPWERAAQVARMQERGNPWQPYEVDAGGNPAAFRLPSGNPLDAMHGVSVAAIDSIDSSSK